MREEGKVDRAARLGFRARCPLRSLCSVTADGCDTGDRTPSPIGYPGQFGLIPRVPLYAPQIRRINVCILQMRKKTILTSEVRRGESEN